MKLPVIALCTMLSAGVAMPVAADTLQTSATGQARTLLYNGESTDSQLVKDRKHRHRHHRHSSSRHRHHHHHHGYHHRYYSRPYYYQRPYYYDPYRYSYPRSGFYFRIF
jgi:Ni/Co efflux regulator RcnB